MVNMDGPTERSLTHTSMHSTFVKLSHRAGYKEDLTAHAIRRAFLNAANQVCTTAQLNQIAGHHGRGEMFEHSYQVPLTKIDGQALMNEQDMRTEHLQFRAMLAGRRQGLPQSLPEHYKAKNARKGEGIHRARNEATVDQRRPSS